RSDDTIPHRIPPAAESQERGAAFHALAQFGEVRPDLFGGGRRYSGRAAGAAAAAAAGAAAAAAAGAAAVVLVVGGGIGQVAQGDGQVELGGQGADEVADVAGPEADVVQDGVLLVEEDLGVEQGEGQFQLGGEGAGAGEELVGAGGEAAGLGLVLVGGE